MNIEKRLYEQFNERFEKAFEKETEKKIKNFINRINKEKIWAVKVRESGLKGESRLENAALSAIDKIAEEYLKKGYSVKTKRFKLPDTHKTYGYGIFWA